MSMVSPNPNIPSLIYYLDYRVYSRPFRTPLHTHHGEWTEREGIILKLSNEQGQVGFGEIAPLPWFGSETLDQALELCQSRASFLSHDELLTIPDTHPASQFGFESALDSLSQSIPRGLTPMSPHCHLLPTGAAALNAWQQPWSEGRHAFKWKIGVAPIEDELSLFEQLMQSLPPAATLRLDANGGLSWATACQWLDICDHFSPPSSNYGKGILPTLDSSPLLPHDATIAPAEYPSTSAATPHSLLPGSPYSTSHPTVEFLEQPLPPNDFVHLLALSDRYQTPIALDESVATFAQLQDCYQNGWQGIFVVKAAIAGSPRRLRRFCQQHELDVVWSSVLETAIARQFITHHLIPTVSSSPRPLGFGVEQWFEPSPLDQTDPAQLWESLG